MEDEYDFSKMKEVKKKFNPPKKGIGMNLSLEVIEYFKTMSVETGVGYQQLINLYLLDCARNKRKIKID